MRRLMILATGLLLLALAALPAGAEPTAHPSAFKAFQTPSKMIGCYYTTGPTVLRCDTVYHTKYYNKKSCREGVYGDAFAMSRSGKARPICRSDTAINPSAHKLRYGTTKHYGPYTCTSRTTGLTCKNKRGHGWKLSKQKQRVF